MGPFTQEDPIGLAGGLNLYGFANGDPVNNSDPFGLCVDPVPCPTFTLLGTAAGFVLGGGIGGVGGLGGGPAAPLTVPAGISVGAVQGAVLGGAAGAAIDVGLVFLKGEAAELGAAISSVLGKGMNTDANRKALGRYCERCKTNRDPIGTKNSRGDFTFSQLRERVMELFSNGNR